MDHPIGTGQHVAESLCTAQIVAHIPRTIGLGPGMQIEAQDLVAARLQDADDGGARPALRSRDNYFFHPGSVLFFGLSQQ